MLHVKNFFNNTYVIEYKGGLYGKGLPEAVDLFQKNVLDVLNINNRM